MPGDTTGEVTSEEPAGDPGAGESPGSGSARNGRWSHERWTNDWSLTTATVSELGPGWYFVVRDGEVSYEALIERR